MRFLGFLYDLFKISNLFYRYVFYLCVCVYTTEGVIKLTLRHDIYLSTDTTLNFIKYKSYYGSYFPLISCTKTKVFLDVNLPLTSEAHGIRFSVHSHTLTVHTQSPHTHRVHIYTHTRTYPTPPPPYTTYSPPTYTYTTPSPLNVHMGVLSTILT